jgi:hypothetical protein
MHLSATKPASQAVQTAVVELRQYTLNPGTRDTLIDLFDREFVETQEACGMSVLGQFSDLDRPDRFVWLRGFSGMASRATALASFCDGPVWAAHSAAANATMIDFDDVLLLRPYGGNALRSLDPSDRTQQTVGGRTVASVVSQPSENTFPRLPVREGVWVVVTLIRMVRKAAFDRLRGAPAGAAALAELARRSPVTRLRLAPTARSLLR